MMSTFGGTFMSDPPKISVSSALTDQGIEKRKLAMPSSKSFLTISPPLFIFMLL
jgi:hypothetical protein